MSPIFFDDEPPAHLPASRASNVLGFALVVLVVGYVLAALLNVLP